MLAVAAAICALLASHHSDEAILEEMRATDQWSYFQAKGIKSAIQESIIEEAASHGRAVPPESKDKVAKYESEMKGAEDKARALEESSEAHMHRHVWLARGVPAYQIAIAMGAVSVLAQRAQ